MAPLVVGIEQAMAALGVGKSFIYAELRAGRLRSIKAGRRTLIPVESLREWLQAREAEASSRNGD